MTLPDGGTITLVDGDGHPTTDVTVPGKGAYHLDADSGVITFTPMAGFFGTAPAVGFRVTDAYGQSSAGTYAAVVAAAATMRVGVRLTPLTVVRPDRLLRPSCQVAEARITACVVVLTARVGRRDVVVGAGRVVQSPGAVGRPATAVVRLNAHGVALAGQPRGMVVTARATVWLAGRSAPMGAATRARVVAASVRATPVFFRLRSARLDRADLRQLAWLRDPAVGGAHGDLRRVHRQLGSAAAEPGARTAAGGGDLRAADPGHARARGAADDG